MKKPITEGQSPGSGAPDLEQAGPSESATLDLPQTIAGVIGVVRGDVSPEEKARATQMLSALRQIRDRSPNAAGRNASPRPQEHADPADGDVSQRQVKLDDILAPTLAEIGYKKVAKLTYRASWSTNDVEQFLALRASGVPKRYLSGDTGFRNLKAEAFAEQCQQRYASQTYFTCMPKGGYVYPPYFCPMHFSVGSLLGWGIRDSLDIWGLSADKLARALVEPIQSKLIPFVSAITTIEHLHDFLESDRELMRWYMRGPYYRAALVAYLARTLGIAREKTKASLLTQARSIENGIDMTRLTAKSYIDHILDDAEAAVAQTAS